VPLRSLASAAGAALLTLLIAAPAAPPPLAVDRQCGLRMPTPDDIERGLDPALARAAGLLGVRLDAECAARFSRR
jgi:hypothetical protein